MRNQVSLSVWVSELAKATVWFVGILIVLVLMTLLVPMSKADTVPVSVVSTYLDENTPIPLAVGVDSELARNLIKAQRAAWGKSWLEDSLALSEQAVIRAIDLYVWSGGPVLITDSCCELVWDQSRLAIDPRLTITADPPALNFGTVEVQVQTPEPRTLLLLAFGLVALLIVRNRHVGL